MTDKAKGLRVLFLNSRSSLEGTDVCLLEIIKNLDKDRIVPFVMLPELGPLVEDLQQAGARKLIYGDLNPLERPEKPLDVCKFLVQTLSSTLRIARIIRQYSIDVVYTNSSAIQTGALAASLCRKPHLWHIREIWSSPRIVSRLLYWFVYHFSDHIITISKAVWRNNFPNRKDKITTLYDGIDIARFQASKSGPILAESFGIPYDSVLIGIVGKIMPTKGHKVLLNAVDRLIHQQDAHLVIVGDVPRKMYREYKDELCQYASKEEISDSVHFVGWSKDIPGWLNLFDVLVVPSIHPEGLGVVILEAWASGVPVIASNHGGSGEIIVHNENGLLFEPGNVDALYNVLRQVVDNKDLRKRLIARGYQTVREFHDSRRNAKKIQEILLRLADGKGRK